MITKQYTIMIRQENTMFSGYKTYITAGVAVIVAVAAYLTGEADIATTAQACLTAVLGATIRNGIK